MAAFGGRRLAALNRDALYVGLLFILTGLYLALVSIAEAMLGLGWSELWPGILALAATALYLPLLVWWEQREQFSVLALPATILLANALLFLYSALTSDWNAWAYLWTLELVALALGILLVWVIGPRDRAFLGIARAIGNVGLLLFAIFGIAFGSGLVRLLAPIVLICLGLTFLIQNIGYLLR